MFVPVILFIIGLCMSAVILPLSVGLYIYRASCQRHIYGLDASAITRTSEW